MARGARTARTMYRWIDHTGELELQIVSDTREDVFRAAVAALAELVREGGSHESTERRQVAVDAPDEAALLAEFLTELIFYIETENFVPKWLVDIDLAQDRVSGTVAGHRGKPPHLVKAITYHRLRFEQAHGKWQANAVLDV